MYLESANEQEMLNLYSTSSSSSSQPFDAFSNAQSPIEYLTAPSTININSHNSAKFGANSPYLFDISNSSFFDLSPMLSVDDPVSLHFLVQNAIAESKGFRIFSYQELNEVKKECQMLESRVIDLNMKIHMENAVRGATASLRKLPPGTNASSEGRKSSLFGNQKKRLSKSVEEAVESSNRKISGFEDEKSKLELRKNELEIKILKHNVGILALTHQGSDSASSKVFSRHTSELNKSNSVMSSSSQVTRKSIGNSNRVQATSRMISQSHSRTTSQVTDDNNRKLDALITSIITAIASPTTSTGSPPQSESKKIAYISELIASLISQYNNSKEKLERKVMQYQELTSIIQEVIVELDPHFSINELNSQDYASLRSQVFYVIDKYRQTRQDKQESPTVHNREDEEDRIWMKQSLVRSLMESKITVRLKHYYDIN